MSYTKDKSLDMLFEYYWEWHVDPATKHGPRSRNKREGASWRQIRDAIKNAPPDPTGERDLTLAEASALFSVEPRKFKGHLRDELLQKALLEGVPERWSAEDAAALLGLEGEQIEALKNEPVRQLRQFSLTPGFRSEKEKAQEVRQGRIAVHPNSKPRDRAAAKRRLAILGKVSTGVDRGLESSPAGKGKKQRVPAQDLIEWANHHPVLNDWEKRRKPGERVGDRGHVDGLLESVQVLHDGTIRIHIGGQTADVSLVTKASGATRSQLEAAVRHIVAKGAPKELDQFGTIIKLETQETQQHTIHEALAFDWQNKEARERLKRAYTESLGMLADELQHAETLAANAVVYYEREKQGEGVTTRHAARLDEWIQHARDDERRAREGRALARGLVTSVNLPRAVETTKRRRPRF
ncbi:hypothetical protein [Coralloluteibacterium stylophorae]|uniref:Uncharacterized protein n=1 Tax=Coralloluteibacterium stylophorae TaxID=1776034 RepID=A0A8J7VZF9_9GAMM|nr:hypothetical protein [Coralloluteibacterium stylophorae]MBS7458897.1 hypothetical protein [Coralloluteibacterium stylophorae]